MNFNGLQKTYWEQQIARVERVREQITARLNISSGRTIPDTTNLAMATGRRLSAAIMFIDICGFSNRPSETEAEQATLMAALNLFFSEMIKIAEDYGGTVEKNTGDGLMAYFEDGTSSPPENGPHRAVACALTMMVASEILINPILTKSGIDPIQFRVCIDSGNVTIAKLGAARRFNAIVAIGTTANIASKMLTAAKAGQILLGENVKTKLPLDWQIFWVKLHTHETGWVFRANQQPYSFYLFDGRWARLL
jgi:adenylate cyclase